MGVDSGDFRVGRGFRGFPRCVDIQGIPAMGVDSGDSRVGRGFRGFPSLTWIQGIQGILAMCVDSRIPVMCVDYSRVGR
jgi:hypothetical protein